MIAPASDRRPGPPPALEEPAGRETLEHDLERAELATLVDRALALLPPENRQILVERYLHETLQARVAARLGLSEGAAAVRLHRGKLALRRVLATELRDEAAAFVVPAPDLPGTTPATGWIGRDGWRETRIRYSICGQRPRQPDERDDAFRRLGHHPPRRAGRRGARQCYRSAPHPRLRGGRRPTRPRVPLLSPLRTL